MSRNTKALKCATSSLQLRPSAGQMRLRADLDNGLTGAETAKNGSQKRVRVNFLTAPSPDPCRQPDRETNTSSPEKRGAVRENETSCGPAILYNQRGSPWPGSARPPTSYSAGLSACKAWMPGQARARGCLSRSSDENPLNNPRLSFPGQPAKSDRRGKSGCASSAKSKSRNRPSSPPSRWAAAERRPCSCPPAREGEDHETQEHQHRKRPP